MDNSVVLVFQKQYQIHSMELFVHSLNVARISQNIGRKMGLSTRELQFLYETGLKHDLGKIRIPREVLLKPGNLTEEERKIMNMHSQYSNELLLHYFPHTLENIEAARIVKYHHENYDGTGYPDGLKGTDIPLYSRIISIADMYDAITHPRVYRKTPMREPLKVMEEELGKKLDEYIYRKYALEELKNL